MTGGRVAKFDLRPFFAPDPAHQARAIFAGGCFWCMVHPFDQLPGIVAVISGFTGGTTTHPTTAGMAVNDGGHVEAVEIIYDTRKICYAQLLALYLQLIDPFDGVGQFQDRGQRYRPVIFYADPEEKAQAATKLVEIAAQTRRPVAVALRPAARFWPAENRQQQFYQHEPKRYAAVLKARRRLMRWQKLARWLHRA